MHTTLPYLQVAIQTIGWIGLGVAAAYSIVTAIAVACWRLQRRRVAAYNRPPITILKPLCGTEPGLYRQLRSFCLQSYPKFHLVCGVRDSTDPARDIALRLQREFPSIPIDVVVDSRLHGANYKISNLLNMLPYARHDVLVFSDSDAYVESDYLLNMTAPLQDRSVGLVTCIYRAVPTSGLWSHLGALYVNDWYMPSVLLAWLFGHQGYVSGQTICMRRDTLTEIGGLDTLVNHLADDYCLGQLVRNLGLQVVLSPYSVDGEHHETSLESVLRHELRWMRTLRALRPASFCGLFVTFTLPLASVGRLAASVSMGGSAPRGAALADALLIAAIAGRLLLHLMQRAPRSGFVDAALILAREFLLCWVWARSFLSSRISWRGHDFDVDSAGLLRRLT